MNRFNTTFKAVFTFVVGVMLLIASFFMSGRAYKHIETRSLDVLGNPVTLSADVIYFCTDQKTSGFKATSPGIDIKFGNQESNAKTEFLTEILKAYNTLP